MDFEKLILSFRSNRISYSKADKDHKNKLLVMKEWERILEEVKVEGKISRPLVMARPNLKNIRQFVSFYAV